MHDTVKNVTCIVHLDLSETALQKNFKMFNFNLFSGSKPQLKKGCADET